MGRFQEIKVFPLIHFANPPFPAKARAMLDARLVMTVPQERRHAHKIVRRRREGEGLVDLTQATRLGLAHAGDGLDPAECLLDSLADPLAVGIAEMASRALVDRRAAATAFARDVWTDFLIRSTSTKSVAS